jgi:hypothetical protein
VSVLRYFGVKKSFGQQQSGIRETTSGRHNTKNLYVEGFEQEPALNAVKGSGGVTLPTRVAVVAASIAPPLATNLDNLAADSNGEDPNTSFSTHCNSEQHPLPENGSG